MKNHLQFHAYVQRKNVIDNATNMVDSVTKTLHNWTKFINPRFINKSWAL